MSTTMARLEERYKTSCNLPPTLDPINSFSQFYKWPRSQYYQLLNFVDMTMEHTSSLITTLQPATSFAKFNQLPPELRIKIWQFSMPDPRTVVVKARKGKPSASIEEALTESLNNDETWLSTTQIPSLLHVNAEARHEALKHYTLSLAVGEMGPRVYIDFNRDTVFFGDATLKPENLSLWAKTKDLGKIKRLATVPEGTWRVLRWTKFGLESLQRLIFVYDTEQIKLGTLPQLVEDEPEQLEDESRSTIEVAIQQHNARGFEITIHIPQAEAESPRKKRVRAAREELETLMRILPIRWQKEPTVSTGVFKKNRGDRWVC